MLAENAVSVVNDELSFEADELAVSSATYSFKEYTEFLQYQFICDFAISAGFAKELLYHALAFNILPSQIFEEMIGNEQLYPRINKFSREFQQTYTRHMFDTEEDLEYFIRANLDEWITNNQNIASISKARTAQELFVGLLYDDAENIVFTEFESAINNLYDGDDYNQFSNLTRHVKTLSASLIINPHQQLQKEISLESEFDLIEWAADGYEQPLSEYKISKEHFKVTPYNFILSPRNFEFVNVLVQRDKDEGKNCFNFLRYTNSSDRKRTIARA